MNMKQIYIKTYNINMKHITKIKIHNMNLKHIIKVLTFATFQQPYIGVSF